MGQYHDAIGAYETVMQGSADALTGFNLALCYYALEDTAQMKKAFVRLVAIPIQVCVDFSIWSACAAQSYSVVQFK
jgi:intraflagellar transport protein 88